MALVKCKNCGHMISDKALKCPECKQVVCDSSQRTSVVNNTNNTNNESNLNVRKSNSLCKTGFILGIISIFLGGLVGLLPIATLIISAIGLTQFKNNEHKNKWQGVVGLILGILYTLVYMSNYFYM